VGVYGEDTKDRQGRVEEKRMRRVGSRAAKPSAPGLRGSVKHLDSDTNSYFHR
jgi:hypothetical protein